MKCKITTLQGGKEFFSTKYAPKTEKEKFKEAQRWSRSFAEFE